jgi:hypothetical protein
MGRGPSLLLHCSFTAPSLLLHCVLDKVLDKALDKVLDKARDRLVTNSGMTDEG